MKIIDVSTTQVFYPDVQPVKHGTSKFSRKHSDQLFVHLKTDEGIEGLGIGEAPPGARAVVENGLRDILIGSDPFDIERLWSEMFWRINTYGRTGIALRALSAVDIGLWDLKAKALSQPLYKLLGGYTESILVYGSSGWTSFTEEELLSSLTKFVELGFVGVKMKVGKDFGNSEREDIDRVAAVRNSIGNDVALYVDANGAYRAKQAIYLAKEYENYQIGWFEEPVIADDIYGLAQVKNSIPIPVATGENEFTRHGFKELMSRDAVDIVQPDVGRVGGVTEWMKIAQLADSFNLQVASHCLQFVHIHLACSTPNFKILESLDMDNTTGDIWYTEVPQVQMGKLSPFPDRPGLGLELDPYAMEKWSVQS
tara:strand:+ start:2043 stop:3146 length:1104 start_codon:yes stop_codon:yes gene_type:complete